MIVFSPCSRPNLLLTIFGLSKLRKPLDSVLEPGDGWVTTAGLFRVGNLMPEPWPGGVAVFSLLWSRCGSEYLLELGDLLALSSESLLELDDLLAFGSESLLELGDILASGSGSLLELGDLLARGSGSLLELEDLFAACSKSLLELGDLLAGGSESSLKLGDLLADRSEQGDGAVPNNSALRMDCHCGQCHNDGSESPLELGDLLELVDLLARGSESLLELGDLLTRGSEFLEVGSESLLKS